MSTGKITRIDARDVWPNEASDFTPWVVDHLEELSSALPFTIADADREQPAGTSRVDIVAKDDEEATVIIENQLDRSNHDHLGKVAEFMVATCETTNCTNNW